MKQIDKQLSENRIQRLRAQGYNEQSDAEITALAFGNRFAYALCGSIMGLGIVTANIPLLIAMALVAFASVVLPYHPFDYIYNHLLRGPLNKPKLPPRSVQIKFACSIASLWLLAIISMFYVGNMVAAYVLGALLFAVAFVVTTTDFCLPSLIFNGLTKLIRPGTKAFNEDYQL